MEIIVSILFAISLLGNVIQGNKINNLEDELTNTEEQRDEFIVIANDNSDKYKLAVKENENYDGIVSSLEGDISTCNILVQEQVDKYNKREEAERLKDAAIKELKKELDNIDFGDKCRVPSGVDFQAEQN